MRKTVSTIWRAVLVLAVCALCTACGNAAKATTMNLAKIDGRVNVLDEDQKELDAIEDMGLYSGYQMETKKKSYAWINLDKVKLAKMDERSDIEIWNSGKDLEIKLNDGSLYFNITEPLEDDETMNIRTSNMGVGIRGTCGWVEKNSRKRMTVYILEGAVECTVTDPDSEEEETVSVSAGQIAVMSLENDEIEITVEQFRESDIPPFVMEELKEDDLEKYRANMATDYGLAAGDRPMLIKIADIAERDVEANTEAYTVAADMSNVDNLWQFYLSDDLAAKLVQNYFVVSGGGGHEFFEVYESNRYNQRASFVTVDSLMHTYHLYFSYLLKNVEKNQLSDSVLQLSRRMLDNSISQYEQLKGTEWEEAAKRNVAFFTVGTKLLDDSIPINDYVGETVSYELNNIAQAAGIQESAVTGEYEDYTQYIPRGYYEGDPGLERYFRAMMWYGRIHFVQENEELDRSALLISKALMDDEEAYGLWEAVYAVTTFFAGASDDLGVCEYKAVINQAYGEDITVAALAGNEEAFENFHAMTSGLTPPRINSVPIEDGEENVILGFRFMGQRFTIDASIMQQLIYRNVGENSAGDTRMLPDVLDVPAALGSDVALRILEENGATGYAGYSENMEKLRTGFAAGNKTLWSASLYANWLNTLRPLLEPKGEGYPVFMRSEEWLKKDLECFAGSFTELKHDTVLYSKQVMPEMGGGYEEITPDDRGYVEPEPLVYERFVNLAVLTADGLQGYGMLGAEDEENLRRLAQMAEILLEISEKELRDEVLEDDEYEFIKAYGGNLEHFWREAIKDVYSSEYMDSRECPSALVVDIATDPNGAVLEAATGIPSTIYVLVKVDGKLKIASGSVYSFYQFPWPMNDRLTDKKWRQMMGWQMDDEGNYRYDKPVKQPEWTESYRYTYEW